ncbi:MAG: Uma2 family endonuclease [Methylocystis sp.]|nr:Uma2 family endonuclease [Methylocystis sp.]
MTGAQVKLPPLMTVADFLEWPGDGTNARYELVDGVLRAMAPPNDTHGLIQSNLAIAIGLHLRENRPGCRINVTPGVQPRLRADWNFRIPDLGVTCAPNAPGVLTMPDPVLLIEVLSPGNANDTWDNVPHYASLPSVVEILIVHSTRIKAELLRRNANGEWPENPEVVDAAGVIHLASIGLDLPLAEVYVQSHLARV